KRAAPDRTSSFLLAAYVRIGRPGATKRPMITGRLGRRTPIIPKLTQRTDTQLLLLFPIRDASRSNTNGDDRASAISTRVEPVEKLTHPRSASAIFLGSHTRAAIVFLLNASLTIKGRSQRLKDRVKFARTRYQNRGINNTALCKRAERIQIAIKR